MEPGDRVELRAHGGARIVRRLIAVSGDRLWVCKQEEYDQAKREARDPVVVGFPKDALIRTPVA